MSKTFKGQHGFFILMLIAVIAVLWISTFMEGTMGNYSYQDYREDLMNGNITEVVIYQNEEAPTGGLRPLHRPQRGTFVRKPSMRFSITTRRSDCKRNSMW